ncbi:MAG: hypothetical protein HC802_17155 [Caldilineaceae bacterium]|nr:hypothetical protein [Caldilineaceae bacterium]
MSDSVILTEASVAERVFEAPAELIWQMWTQAEHFRNWYGPTGFTIPVPAIGTSNRARYNGNER